MHITGESQSRAQFESLQFNSNMKIATGGMYDMKGHRDLFQKVRAIGPNHETKLSRVAYGLKIGYDLFSLRAAGDAGHRYEGTTWSITLFRGEGGEYFLNPQMT